MAIISKNLDRPAGSSRREERPQVIIPALRRATAEMANREEMVETGCVDQKGPKVSRGPGGFLVLVQWS